MSFSRWTPRSRSDTPAGRSSATSARAVSESRICPPCAAAPTRAARCTPIPTYPWSPAFGSPLCNPIRTRTCNWSGHSCAASSRCASVAADTASRAERNAQNNESPCVSTTRPSCAATAARNKLVVLCQHGLVAIAAKLLQQLGRTLDVGEQEGDRAAGEPATCGHVPFLPLVVSITRRFARLPQEPSGPPSVRE